MRGRKKNGKRSSPLKGKKLIGLLKHPKKPKDLRREKKSSPTGVHEVGGWAGKRVLQGGEETKQTLNKTFKLCCGGLNTLGP